MFKCLSYSLVSKQKTVKRNIMAHYKRQRLWLSALSWTMNFIFKCTWLNDNFNVCLLHWHLIRKLIIFLINIGTREEKDHNSVKKTKPWYDGLETVMRKIFLYVTPSNLIIFKKYPKIHVCCKLYQLVVLNDINEIKKIK